ncbi:MAG TPA: polysaccharide lyase 8 family protein [Candidatus Limnocylindrales bacterium]
MAEYLPRPHLSRRGLLAGLGGAAGLMTLGLQDITGLAPGAWAASATAPGDAFDRAREIWRHVLTGGDFDPADPDLVALVVAADNVVASNVALLDRSANRAQVFVDQRLVAENNAEAVFRITRTFNRLQAMAVAFRTPGSRYQDDASLLVDILAGLETVYQRVYNENQEEFGDYWGSWYGWEIANPNALNATCTLVYDHLPAGALAGYLAAIDHFVPDPRFTYPASDPVRHRLSTGANRIDLCLNVMVRGVLGRDEQRILTARSALAEELRYVSAGDGFHHDGSFLQHETVAYNGHYGRVLLGGFARMPALLAGSPWQITGAEARFVFETVERSFMPFIYDNQMMDFVRGRIIARWNERDHRECRATVDAILRLAEGTDPETTARWRAICNGWLERDTYESVLIDGNIPRIVLFKALLADPSVRPAPEPVNHTLFPEMDRAIHRRPGWALAIAMASKRISYYEHTNSVGENKKGFHTGDGMTYLYNSDNAQYAAEFWPTVDLYRLPGITVDPTPLPDGAGGSERPRPAQAKWVGGATIGGQFAAVGMELEPLLSALRAKKSWFCFDQYVVALGAGITRRRDGATQSRIETVVENRNLHASGTNALLVDGAAQPVTPGWDRKFQDPTWAHLEGVGGYVFPAGGSLRVLREERTGSWRNMHRTGPTAPITRRYVTMWFDHGDGPVDESYAYLLLPGASPARTAEIATDPGNVQILVNTNEIQAVRVPRLGLTAMNFWQAGSQSGIIVDAPCSLLIRQHGGSLSVAVSDPTQELASLSVTLDRPGYRSWTGDDTIGVEGLGSRIAFAVDTAGTNGRTHMATFHRG